MEIKVLMSCCAKLDAVVEQAVKELGIDANIEKVTNMQEIMKYTISTPGLVLNGKLKHSGNPMPGLERVKAMIKSEV